MLYHVISCCINFESLIHIAASQDVRPDPYHTPVHTVGSPPDPSFDRGYPLVNIQKATEHGHRNSVFFPSKMGDFSIVRLVYQGLYLYPTGG